MFVPLNEMLLFTEETLWHQLTLIRLEVEIFASVFRQRGGLIARMMLKDNKIYIW